VMPQNDKIFLFTCHSPARPGNPHSIKVCSPFVNDEVSLWFNAGFLRPVALLASDTLMVARNMPKSLAHVAYVKI
ncbi:MAG: hypothetical protein JW882_12575, partial [Deltaproteobacteria bacterium]|nr:hypothetical protein [Deltaproteobacteria bacterium]